MLLTKADGWSDERTKRRLYALPSGSIEKDVSVFEWSVLVLQYDAFVVIVLSD